MKAHQIREGYWQVESQQGWWTAKQLPHLPGGWYIENSKCRQVSPTGALGRKIIASIKESLPEGPFPYRGPDSQHNDFYDAVNKERL